MKKLYSLVSFVLFLACVIFFSGCSKKNDGQWHTFNLYIEVINAENENLLDYETQGNILENHIVVKDGDMVYENGIIYRTRTDPAPPLQPYTQLIVVDGLLQFGRLTSQSLVPYGTEYDFTIDWGDGTNDEIKIVHIWSPEEEFIPKVYVNGILSADGYTRITIVK